MNADYNKEILINELKHYSLPTLCLALTYAKYIQKYAIDVTTTLNTATTHASELDKAYIKGRLDERYWTSQKCQ